MRRVVEALHVDVTFAQVDSVHSAANIHTHDVRDGLVDYGHGGANGAAASGVNIRHDPDTAVPRKLIVAHSPYLLDGVLIHNAGIADGGIQFSFDLNHKFSPPI